MNVTLLVSVMLCLLAAANADQRRHKPRVNFKGDSVGHSNYGRSFDDRKKVVDQRLQNANLNPQNGNVDSNTDFLYFKMHDRDGNGMLDGTELARMFMEDDGEADFDEELLKLMVAHTLEEDDANNDGYIDWAEFKKSEDQHIGA